MGIQSNNKSLIFSYGTLKRGFSNHVLMQDLIKSNDATFVGTYQTSQNYPLVCGPYRVPFLLNLPGSGHRVTGELYAVTTRGLARLDELEGTSRGHYKRLPIKCKLVDGDDDEQKRKEEDVEVEAEAYFAHESYAMELWKKNGKKGYTAFTEKEARGYIKRKDRPQNLTFLDQIQIFVSSSD